MKYLHTLMLALAILLAGRAYSLYAAPAEQGVAGDQAIGGNSKILGNSTVYGNQTVGGTLAVTGEITATGGLGATTLSSATVTGATLLNGTVGLGNASGDAITVTGTMTSTPAITATNGFIVPTKFTVDSNGNLDSAGGAEFTGHVVSKGTVPVASAGTIDTKSTDHAGIVKTVGATSAAITFATAYAAEPVCVVSAEEAIWITAKGTTSFSVAATGNIDDMSYACWEIK